MEQQKPKRKRRKRTKRNYFTKVHEEAILEYCITESYHRKNELYETLIQGAFHELVEKIVATYKFHTLPNIEELKSDCKIWLTTYIDQITSPALTSGGLVMNSAISPRIS